MELMEREKRQNMKRKRYYIILSIRTKFNRTLNSNESCCCCCTHKTKLALAKWKYIYPSSNISGLGCPISAFKLLPNEFGSFPPFSQYETGAGEASTWQFNCTSDPSGAPNSWLGALTDGEKCTERETRFETAGGTSFDAMNEIQKI